MFELVLELNKMCCHLDDRAMARAIRTAILEITEDNAKKMMFSVVKNLNDLYKMFEEIIPEMIDDLKDLFMNKYLDTTNKYYFLCTGESIYGKISGYYWADINKQILQLWKDASFDEKDKDDLFIKIFEDTVGSMLKSNPSLCERTLEQFSNLYRATTYMPYDAYKFIIPNPRFCKENRWNDDGVAFLYLAYDDEDREYEGIKVAQKTCFEECRLTEGKEVAICQFKSTHDEAKIMYLAYQDIDYDKMLVELDRFNNANVEELLDQIEGKEKVKNKLSQYAKSGRKDLFNRTIKNLMNQTGMSLDLKERVEKHLFITLLGNICDSIFYVVDKKDDPGLEAYIPFRKFSKYLMSLGYAGVAFRSTRMEMIGLKGTNLVLFDPKDAEPVADTMKVYRYHRDQECELINEY